MNTKINVLAQDGDEPATIEMLERSIVEIANGMSRLNATRLKRETVVTLLHDHSRVSKTTIRIVLNCMDELETIYLKPKPAAPFKK